MRVLWGPGRSYGVPRGSYGVLGLLEGPMGVPMGSLRVTFWVSLWVILWG